MATSGGISETGNRTDKKMTKQLCRASGCYTATLRDGAIYCDYHTALFNALPRENNKRDSVLRIGEARIMPPDLETANKIKHYMDKAHRDNDGCLINHLGYPTNQMMINVNGVRQKLVNVIWEALGYEVPSGMFLNMKCGEPTCLNPAHWFWGDKDMYDESRYVHIIDKYLSKEVVQRIIDLHFANGMSQLSIAERFDIPLELINQIANLHTHSYETKAIQ